MLNNNPKTTSIIQRVWQSQLMRLMGHTGIKYNTTELTTSDNERLQWSRWSGMNYIWMKQVGERWKKRTNVVSQSRRGGIHIQWSKPMKVPTWSCVHDVGLSSPIWHQPRRAGHADWLWTYWLDPAHVHTVHYYTHRQKKTHCDI